jgi:hypothetical protein
MHRSQHELQDAFGSFDRVCHFSLTPASPTCSLGAPYSSGTSEVSANAGHHWVPSPIDNCTPASAGLVVPVVTKQIRPSQHGRHTNLQMLLALGDHRADGCNFFERRRTTKSGTQINVDLPPCLSG